MSKQSSSLKKAPRLGWRSALLRVDSSAIWRLIIALAVGALTIYAFSWSLDFLRDASKSRLVKLLTAISMGLVGVWALYWSSDTLISVLPLGRLRERLRPIVFVGPALAFLIVFLIYPMVMTVWLSFRDKESTAFNGLDNYTHAFTDAAMRGAMFNNVKWILIVTTLSVVLGLVIAVLIDRVRYESAAKSLIFLPMVISFVGAGVIWRFVYAYQPPDRPQTGLLNALMVAGGKEPLGWLIERQFNNFALMSIMIWLQTGFCLVIISAALKGVPGEILDAARIDGANEFQVFFQIIIPSLKGTLLTVATTVLIAVLKVFDIVYVMTNGQNGTEVIANRMYREMFKNFQYGRGSALAVILLIAVIPVMVINVRNLRRQRSE